MTEPRPTLRDKTGKWETLYRAGIDKQHTMSHTR